MGSPYDYNSVMHYRSHYFSVNGKDTMERVDGVKPPDFNNNYGLTNLDANQLKGLYRCEGEGEWETWAVVEPCSVTCGTGSASRRRDCRQRQDSPSVNVVMASCIGMLYKIY